MAAKARIQFQHFGTDSAGLYHFVDGTAEARAEVTPESRHSAIPLAPLPLPACEYKTRLRVESEDLEDLS